MGWTAWDSNAPEQGRGIVENPVVTQLVPDPTVMPDLVLLRGMLGRAPQDNLWRVYHDLELTRFTEVMANDIVWALPGPDGLETMVWARRSDALRAGISGSLDAGARFLTGGIAQGAAGPDDRGGGWDPDPTRCYRCSTYTPCGGG